MNSSLTQWQGNVIEAEHYLYSDSTIQNVLIGTSISGALIKDSIPDIERISLAGLSIFDGLNIINHKKTVPKNLFIEMDFVSKPESSDFTNAVFFYPSLVLKKYAIGLRTDKEPMAIACKYIASPVVNKLYYSLYDHLRKLKERIIVPKKATDAQLFNYMINMKKKNLSESYDSVRLQNQFKRLKIYVDDLKSIGVHVIFFDIPLQPDITDLPVFVKSRAMFLKYFPATEFDYIDLPQDYKDYRTNDGIHLGGVFSEKYSGYFRIQASKYLK